MTRTIMPMLSYEDIGTAADWLVQAFGFRETLRYEENGRPLHVELQLGDGWVLLGNPSPHYESPRHHRETCEAAARWSESPYIVDGVHVYLDDVDAHFERARAAGARILSEVEDTPYGDRQYRAEDLEGHRWMFAQHVRDVPAQEWGGTEASP
jgi:PhnB protein